MSNDRPSKRRRLSPPGDQEANAKANAPSDTNLATQAGSWTIEQDYETRPRKRVDPKVYRRLPIKDGRGVFEQPVEDSRQHSPSSFESLDDGTPPTDVSEPDKVPAVEEISPRARIIQAKEELARIASLINEAPEENSGSLKILAQITNSPDSTVIQLGLATQLSVYKDIIPGYRIRALSEEETKEKVSKDVRQQRSFEQAIVRGYQAYVKNLGRIARLDTSASSASSGLVDVAFSCICNLLENVAHFNFRHELLKVVTDRLATRRLDHNSEKCISSLQNLFDADEDGNASLEAVLLLSKLIKNKHFNVNEAVINTFLHLRLLSEFSQKGSHTKIDYAETNPDDPKPKMKSEVKREHRSKAERKLAKERKNIEHEFQEADATVGHEERDKNQSETLKLVFGIYFRILKARTPWLMGAVLEGLVKYAHLINQDFFGDLLEALKELIQDAEIAKPDDQSKEGDIAENDNDVEMNRNLTRESLLCVVTAFGLLQGQDAAASASTLGLDLQFFIAHLYRTLYTMSLNADIELSPKTLRAPDPNGASQSLPNNKINVSTTIVMYLRSLQGVLLPDNARSVPPVRLAAFSKQLLTSSLHMPERSCASIVSLMNRVAKTHRRRIAFLWHTEERRGDGVFDPLTDEMEGSNPFAGTVWDGELLRLHYSPMVREGVHALDTILNDI